MDDFQSFIHVQKHASVLFTFLVASDDLGTRGVLLLLLLLS